MRHKIIHLAKKVKSHSGFGIKLTMFLLGVFVGAIGVVIALNVLTVSTPVKQTGRSMSPGYPPSFSNYPPGPPPAGSPSGK